MIDDYYELRIYQCAPGRLPDLHHRMGYEIPPLFESHGIPTPLAYWEGYAGPYNPLYCYILRWPDLDERMRAFGKFYSDPLWAAQRDASDCGSSMVERIDLSILRPAPCWEKLKVKGEPRPVGGLHELRLQTLSTRNMGDAYQALGEVDLPYLRDQGAEILGVFTKWYGGGTPQAVILLAWEGMEQREAAMQAYDGAPEIIAKRQAEQAQFGEPLFGRSDVHLMIPAPYGVAKSNLSA